MTRVQRERFDSLEEYERLKDSYISRLKSWLTQTRVITNTHPLPRVNKISVAVDDDPRACYFRQALNGKYMRMGADTQASVEAEKNTRPAKAGRGVYQRLHVLQEPRRA